MHQTSVTKLFQANNGTPVEKGEDLDLQLSPRSDSTMATIKYQAEVFMTGELSSKKLERSSKIYKANKVSQQHRRHKCLLPNRYQPQLSSKIISPSRPPSSVQDSDASKNSSGRNSCVFSISICKAWSPWSPWSPCAVRTGREKHT